MTPLNVLDACVRCLVMTLCFVVIVLVAVPIVVVVLALLPLLLVLAVLVAVLAFAFVVATIFSRSDSTISKWWRKFWGIGPCKLDPTDGDDNACGDDSV